MQAFNPFLPSWEYIPDGEPRLFGGRVYLYGSHDRFNAPIFCMGDYVCWSAPAEDLRDWRYEGVIYRRNQDPRNRSGLRLLFAPDVVQGPDGRYYLYYAFDFMGIIGVAVSDHPAGPYQFHGHVHDRAGRIWGRRKGDQFPFDPAVLVDDDGQVYLYSGFHTPVPAILTGFLNLRHDGGTVARLEPDMLTLQEEPRVLFPVQGPGAFDGHEFFEASSIRKDGEKYIFSYSSRHNHELCYAVSDHPDRDFTFGGTLVDQGDLFMDGRTDEARAMNYLGNTHGGMLNIGSDWYTFYHRQTNQHSYSRQACAEKLEHPALGVFRQAPVTSCGLNGGPLKGTGSYEARIACHLWSQSGTARYDKPFDRKAHPYFTQTGWDREQNGDQYIANMRDGSTAGYRSFLFDHESRMSITISGRGSGRFEVSHTPDGSSRIAELPVNPSGAAVTVSAPMQPEKGVKALYFRYRGDGAVHFHGFDMA